MTRTTLPRDLVSLLAAVDASPDDTDTQLVLADWLESQDSPRVKCPKCVAGGLPPKKVWATGSLTCSTCSGTGSVQDHDLRDRAEYIRVQVELGRGWPVRKRLNPRLTDANVRPTHECIVCGALWVEWSGGGWSLLSADCGPCCDNAAMGSQIQKLPPVVIERLCRERSLLAANRARWCPAAACPGCDGRGWIYSGHNTCLTCHGAKDLLVSRTDDGGHVDIRPRIDPDLDFYADGRVPWPWSVGCRLEEVGREEEAGYKYGSHMAFTPSPWALAVLAACPTIRGFRVTDREPYYGGNDEYAWMRGMDGDAANRLPESVWDRLNGEGRRAGLSWKVYATRKLAERALSRALYTLVAKGGTPP